jgi:hypothetical protein
MTTRRQALAGLGVLLAPGMAAAQGNSQGKGQGRERRPPAGNGGPKPEKGKPGAGPRPARATPASSRPAGRDDAPSLRPLEREQVRGWLAANPGWTPPPSLPPGQQQRLAQGKPLPPGMARQALPPGLATTLPYFPGYRYFAVGPDLVLVAAATGVVTSLLAGALAP